MARNEAKLTLSAEDKASAVLKNVRNQVEQLRASNEKLGAITGSLGGPLAAIGTSFAAGGLLGIVKDLAGALDDLDESAQGLGVSAIALAEFRIAAREAGLDANTLDKAIAGLTSKMNEAATGGNNAAVLFKALGVSSTDAAGKLRSSEDVMADIADAFKKMENGAAKTALATELFGEKLGRKLIPYLNGGAEGLRKYAGVTDDAVRASAELQKQFDELAANTDVFKNKLAGSLIPVLNDLLAVIKQVDFSQAFNIYKEASFAAIPRAVYAAGRAIEDAAKKTQQAKEALASVPPEGIADPNLNRFKTSADSTLATYKKLQAELTKKPLKAPVESEKITDAQRALAGYIESLQKQRDTLEEITEVERALALLKANPAIDTAQVRELVLEQARLTDSLKVEAEMRREIERATKAQIEAEKALRDQVLDLAGITDENRKVSQTKQLEKMIQEGIISPEQAERAVRGIAGIREEVETAKSSADEFALVMQSAVSSFFANPGQGAGKFFKAVEADISQLITKLLVLEPLAAGIKALFNGGSFSDAFSGASGAGNFFSGLGNLFAGFFADGGSIAPGKWGIVGERGPELSFGGASGKTIVPQMMGATNITINVPAGTGRDTANQTALEVSRALSRAQRRFA